MREDSATSSRQCSPMIHPERVDRVLHPSGVDPTAPERCKTRTEGTALILWCSAQLVRLAHHVRDSEAAPPVCLLAHLQYCSGHMRVITGRFSHPHQFPHHLLLPALPPPLRSMPPVNLAPPPNPAHLLPTSTEIQPVRPSHRPESPSPASP